MFESGDVRCYTPPHPAVAHPNRTANDSGVAARQPPKSSGFTSPLTPPQLREFHITIDFENLSQMQSAFDNVSSRADPVESLHHVVNSKVQDVFFALYRDFPDDTRVYGQEKF